jgi:hypothetical protein
VNLAEGKCDMRSVFLASGWTAAALAIALFAVTGDIRADNEPQSKNKGKGSGGARSSSGGGEKPSTGGGGKSGTGGGGKPSAGGRISSGGRKPASGGGRKSSTGGRISSGGGKSSTGGGRKSSAGGRISSGGGKPSAGGGGKSSTGGGRKSSAGGRISGGGKSGAGGGIKPNYTGPGKAGWNSWTKNGWTKNSWNSNLNSQHYRHHHGYWNNGIWIAPWVIAYNQPWVYLQPPQPIVSGQKWLGVTYRPYDGGGAYISGIYQGSPAQAVGLEVGDVVVSLDGVDATNLGNVLQASDGNVVLQVLSGRTGELVQSRVNLIR